MTERILICGDRHWTCEVCIYRFLESYVINTPVIIEGDARGADRMAGIIGSWLNLIVEVYPADWEKYGKSAGPIRNRQMLKEGKPTRVIAFHNDIASSKGTKNMVEQAQKAGLPTEVRTCPHRTTVRAEGEKS